MIDNLVECDGCNEAIPENEIHYHFEFSLCDGCFDDQIEDEGRDGEEDWG